MPRLVTGLLGLLLAAMAILQLIAWDAFVGAVASYELGGETTTGLVARLLVIAEAAGAVALLLAFAVEHRALARRGAVISMGIFIAWTVIGGQAFVRGLEVSNCGCFGSYASQELRWWVLLEDLALIAASRWLRTRSASLGRVTPVPAARPAHPEGVR